MDITYKYETTFLILHLTEDIKWDNHVKHWSSQLNISYYVTQFLQGKTSVNILKSMYFANFHSHLRYVILFWGGDGERKKIFKLQIKVMRLISNVGRDTSCRILFKALYILPCMYIMQIVYYVKLNISGTEQNSVRHNYNTCTHHR